MNETTTAAPVAATVPAGEAETANDASPAAATPAAEDNRPAEQEHGFTVPVTYNRQRRELTPDEATLYAQKGMKYESMEPSLDKLRQLAAAAGQPLTDFLDHLTADREQSAYQQLVQQCGGNEEMAAEVFRARQHTEAPDTHPTEQRLAEEFAALRRANPAIGEFSSLPAEVIALSAEQGVPLMYGYAYHAQQEQARIDAAATTARQAAQASLGSQQSQTTARTPETDAVIRGVWRA